MAQAKMKWQYDAEHNVLTATFISGYKLELDLIDLVNDDMIHMAIQYGIKQKLVDKTARNAGETLTEAELIECVKENWSRLTSDNPTWNVVGSKKESLKKKIQEGAETNLTPEEQERLNTLMMKAIGKNVIEMKKEEIKEEIKEETETEETEV